MDTAENTTDATADVVPERRVRGGLESDIKVVTDKYVTGEFSVGENETLTPHRIAKAIQANNDLENMPSPGAVSAALKRWEAIGFAKMTTKPYAFDDYTDEGRDKGLTALKAERKAAVQAAKPEGAPGKPKADKLPEGDSAKDANPSIEGAPVNPLAGTPEEDDLDPADAPIGAATDESIIDTSTSGDYTSF